MVMVVAFNFKEWSTKDLYRDVSHFNLNYFVNKLLYHWNVGVFKISIDKSYIFFILDCKIDFWIVLKWNCRIASEIQSWLDALDQICY